MTGAGEDRRIMMSVVLLAACAVAVAAPPPPSLVGTYRLISTKQTVVATGKVAPFGDNSVGYIMYGADGRMMALVGDGNRRPTQSSNALDDATKVRLFDSMGGYGGTYTFDGKKVIHHIDIATRPAMVGTDVVRYIELRGDKLIYSTKAGPSPRDGVVVTLEFVWQKVPDGYLAPIKSK
jgi:hypothetical protein